MNKPNEYLALLCAAFLSCAGMVLLAHAEEPNFDAHETLSAARAAATENTLTLPSRPQTSTRDAASADDVERAIVVFRKGAPIALPADIDVVKDLRLIHAVAIVAPKSRMKSLKARLISDPNIQRVDSDPLENWLHAVITPSFTPPHMERWWPWPPQPKLSTPWGIKRVNAAKAWKTSKGKGVKVAVIDTGIDTDHKSLKVAGGFNTITENGDFKDDHGHGTHVAGTIAASWKIGGVAPEASLYGVKVLDARGRGYYSDIIEGIQWCVENDMDIVNMSLGGSSSVQALADAVRASAQANTVIIAAAGNSGGSVGYPAKYPETITVSASDFKDAIAGFSSRGPEVDFIAPGVAIESTKLGGGTHKMSGTSMASPHVAGLAVLAVATQKTNSFSSLKAALGRAAKKLPGLSAEQQGRGMIDAADLVK